MNSESSRTSFVPDYAVPPGITLHEMLEHFGISQAELAERTGRPKKTINEIVKGKAAITPETALQLERALGPRASFWNSLEQNYRAALARMNEREKLAGHVDWLSNFPVRALIERDWLIRSEDKVTLLQHLLRFFGVASPEAWAEVWRSPQQAISFRQAASKPADVGALTSWLRKGEMLGRELACAPYDEARFKTALQEIRSLTAEEPNKACSEAKRLCASAGVAFVLVPELPKLRICGATRWLSPEKALVQLSLFYKRDDQFWFSFFHEAGHILLHGKKDIFVEQERGSKDREEQEANAFAANYLIPAIEFEDFVAQADFSSSAIKKFAETLGVSASIVVGRLQHDKLIGFNERNELHTRLMWA
jgi:HTH-type transcriptional regulator/antitoxin HigA